MKKRVIAMLLAVIMLIALLPVSAIAAGEVEYYLDNSTYVLFNKATGMITGIRGPSISEVILPEKIDGFEVTGIADLAFMVFSMEKVVLPNTVTSIGEDAFYGCRSLNEVTLSNTLTSIGATAFAGCTALENITFPESLTSIGVNAFNDTGLISVTIPKNVTSMDEAFRGARSLTSVTLEEGVTAIGKSTFEYCPSLWEVSIPASVVSIGDSAFQDCETLPSITIPASVKTIGKSAFENCWSLKEAALTPGLSSIGARAFYNCTRLGSITIPDTVTSIGSKAFSKAGLTEVTFPIGRFSIGEEAFYDCDKLTELTIPDTVISIGSDAFASCDALSVIYFRGTQDRWANLSASWRTELTATVHYDFTTEEEHFTEQIIHPTCIDEGYTLRTCICGYEEMFDFTEPLNPSTGHDFGLWTDTGDGKNHKRTCQNAGCGTSETEAHTWDNGVILTAPTVNTTGERLYTCTSCMASKIESIPKVSASVNFKDVAKNAYYYNAVAWAVENKITGGTSPTTFSPGSACTRGQIVMFLWKAAGSPEPATKDNPFTDVKEGAYYYKAVLWAVENGITGGTSPTTFSPGSTCTRAQTMTFIYSYEGRPQPENTTSKFVDVKEGSYYYNAVLWAVENGITGGTSPTKFSPGNTCTRGQIVTFLYKDMVPNTEPVDYSDYVGEWISTKDLWNKGGVILEIKSIKNNAVKFDLTSVSSAPYNRIAYIENVSAEIVGGVVNFSFKDDGWGNSGSGMLVLRSGKVYVETSISKYDSNAMWDLGNISITMSK